MPGKSDRLLGLGDYNQVFEYLQKAVDEHLGGVLFINSYPIWEPLRADDRFKKLLHQIGIEREIRSNQSVNSN
ncbi:MAG: hypothetical protein U5K69_27300 [Balneolaceae bacterium]|nr:hypothetical protein [Balneolaceae bacterium]